MQTFTKEFRLVSKQDFINLRNGSTRVVVEGLIAYYKKNNLGHARIGFGISRKTAKAYLRNKLRRKLREFFRLSPIRSMSVDILLVVLSPNNLLQSANIIFSRIIEKC